MKKYAVGLFSMMLSFSVLFGCNASDDDQPTPGDQEEEKEQQRDLYRGNQ